MLRLGLPVHCRFVNNDTLTGLADTRSARNKPIPAPIISSLDRIRNMHPHELQREVEASARISARSRNDIPGAEVVPIRERDRVAALVKVVGHHIRRPREENIRRTVLDRGPFAVRAEPRAEEEQIRRGIDPRVSAGVFQEQDGLDAAVVSARPHLCAAEERGVALRVPDFPDDGGDDPARVVEGPQAAVWLALGNTAGGGFFVVWLKGGGGNELAGKGGGGSGARDQGRTLAVDLEFHDAPERVEAGGHHPHFHLVGHDGGRDIVKRRRERQDNHFLTCGVVLEPGLVLATRYHGGSEEQITCYT